MTCIDTSVRMIEAARERLQRLKHATARVADAQALPFSEASFDSVLMFHTLTYAEDPAQALSECARVLRPGGRLVLLCLDEHRQLEITAPYGERHAGFSPAKVRELLTNTGLVVRTAEVACRESRKPHLQVVLAIAGKAALPRN